MKTITLIKEIQDELDLILIEDYKIISREQFIQFLSFITKLSSLNKDGMAYFSNNNIRSEYGRKKINGKTFYILDLIIDICIKRNILCVTNYSIDKKQTRKYYFSNLIFNNINFKEFTLTSQSLSYATYTKIQKEYSKPTDKDCIPQYNLLKSDRFKIDEVTAIEWVLTKYNNKEITQNQLMSYTKMIMDLVDKNIISIKGSQSGRIFTNFNLIKRELRQFCSIDNEYLNCIDLKTAQPFFLASKIIIDYPDLDDAHKLYDIVINDDIYNYFLNIWNDLSLNLKRYNKDKNIVENVVLTTRDASKIEFLRFIFKQSKNGSRAPYDIIFEKEFKTLYKLINKKDLSIDLQKLESSIFIPVCNKLCSEGCLSVHDSLYFKNKLSGSVLSDLDKEFKKNNLINYNLA